METEINGTFHQKIHLLNTVALVILALLPFVGIYIGYVFSPEKIVEIERIIGVEVKQEYEGTELPWFEETVIRDIESPYFQAALEYLNLNETDEYFLNPEVFDYSLRARRLSEYKVLLNYCFECTHMPSGFLVFDQQSSVIERELTENELPQGTQKWLQMRAVDTNEIVTVMVDVGDKKVVAYDYANNVTIPLYVEDEANVTLCGFIGIICVTDYFITPRGQIVFAKYTLESGAVESGSFIAPQVVMFPQNYEYRNE
jgi:hypothetical protein